MTPFIHAETYLAHSKEFVPMEAGEKLKGSWGVYCPYCGARNIIPLRPTQVCYGCDGEFTVRGIE